MTDSLIVLGVDTGGTFTDFVVLRGDRVETAKVLSTPDDPARAIGEGLEKLGLAGRALDLVHGTTVGTNAVLEGATARVLYVCNAGFADLLTLARQNREHLYRLEQPPVAPPVARADCLEVGVRRTKGGQVLDALSEADLAALRARLESRNYAGVAVNLLFSFVEAADEERLGEAARGLAPVSLSSRVLPEIREYERGIATWLNAAVGPLLADYLGRLDARMAGGHLSIMQSDGTTVAADQAAGRAVHLLLSGPAGGLAAAGFVGHRAGEEQLLTFDMGGTSTDVAMVAREPALTRAGRIAGYPVAVPMVDMVTIGAGGGSIARMDAGGVLRVGPESAGADPGPACYGRGGQTPTVTDAHAVLGHIPESARLGGSMPLDTEAARTALGTLAESLGESVADTARGILRVADEHMSRALRTMSAERGLDPAQLCLVSFGGAGGLHVCALAGNLGMRRALVPARSGVLSAVGMLVARPGRHLTRSLLVLLEEVGQEDLETGFAALRQAAAGELEAEGIDPAAIEFSQRVECRYRGQDATLALDADSPERLIEAFQAAHEAEFGYRLELPVEAVNLRLEARGPARVTELPPAAGDGGSWPQATVAGCADPVPVQGRGDMGEDAVPGPRIVVDADATTWVAPGWTVRRNRAGDLVLGRT